MRRALLLFSIAASAWGQAVPLADPGQVKRIYERLLPRIDKIAIFDDHAHPGYADDPDVDAMAAPPGSSPLRLSPDNPELALAAKALFKYPYSDLKPEHAAWLAAKKKELRQDGTAYFDHLLDQLNIAESVANRVAMPSYLDPKRFRWVCFVDSLLFPFDNKVFIAKNPDEEIYIPLQENKLKREMKAVGLAALPKTLDGYLGFVTRTLEENQKNGAVGVKFEAAYFRSLHFGDPPRREAAVVYDQFRKGRRPDLAQYTIFQDYVVRYLVRESGRLRLPVTIHTSVGIGEYFNLHNGNVMNLENVLRDSRYSNVSFVLLHGGYPYDGAAIWLAMRKNVYIDSSFMELALYPSEFKKVLKRWLEVLPDKVVYGSDAFPFNDALGAEECYWLAVKSARTALAAALAEMVAEREITEIRAPEMARNYLHDTAAGLYRAR